jgi:hypothetical protein
MDGICCNCKQNKKCYRIDHPKIKEIKRLYKELFNHIPNPHERLLFCGDCGNLVLNELKLEQKAIYMHKIGIPLSIETDQNNSSFTCTTVNIMDPGYKIISKRFNQTMQNKIIRIEKIHNPLLLANFQQMKLKLQDENEQYLFHGSANQNDILQNGFSLQYAKESGSLGAGIYFAKDASYSNSYTYSIPTKEIGNIKNMLCARVIFGKIGINTKHNGGSSEIWAVFHESQCYPEFIIYYESF